MNLPGTPPNPASDQVKPPNIVLIMADDVGWGDIGFNGNPKVRTPILDRLAREGVQLSRFYAGGPVCTPTRSSCLTGRASNRYGMTWAGRYPLPREEVTLAGVLKDAGYRTGFFGKWHLGKLSPTGDEGFSREKPVPTSYSAPWHHGFDTCFAVESATPNYNPEVWDDNWNQNSTAGTSNKYIMDRPIEFGENTRDGKPMVPWPYHFWHGENKPVAGPLAGDTSDLLVKQAIPFIEQSVADAKPFLATVWFITAHTPVSAGPEHRARYPDLTMREQHWFGAISAMDDAIGNLLETLKKLRVDQNTLVWFCSDNGPSWVHELNSAGPFRGKKADLFEGGIRVPAVVRWPAGIQGGRTLDLPLCTHDFLPTFIAAAKLSPKKTRPLDGENVLPLLTGERAQRRRHLHFDYPMRVAGNTWVPGEARQVAVMEGDWKILSRDGAKSFQLYNLAAEINEQTDRAAEKPEIVNRLHSSWQSWSGECAASLRGEDYR